MDEQFIPAPEKPTVRQVIKSELVPLPPDDFPGDDAVDVIDYDGDTVIEQGSDTEYKSDPESLKSLGSMIKACYQDFGLKPSDVWKELGYSGPQNYPDTPADAYRAIAIVRQGQ